MLHYFVAFFVTLAVAGALMASVNCATPSEARRRRNWLVALGIAVGTTMAEVVTDCFPSSFDYLVRPLVVGIGVALVPPVIENIYLPKPSPSEQ